MLVAVLLVVVVVNFDIYMHIHRSLLVVVSMVVVLADSVSILLIYPSELE